MYRAVAAAAVAAAAASSPFSPNSDFDDDDDDAFAEEEAPPRLTDQEKRTLALALPLGPMLRCLGSDIGAQFTLCQLLTLRDMRALHTSCSRWRRWVDVLPVSAITPTVTLRSSRIADVPHSRWAGRWIDSVSIVDAWPRNQARDAEKSALFYSAVRHLPSTLPLLRRLELTHYGPLNVPSLAACFVVLAPTLQELKLTVCSRLGSHLEPRVDELLRSFAPLRRMHALHLHLTPLQRGSTADLAPLCLLPRLTTLILGCGDSGFHNSSTTSVQLRSLASCARLTHLAYGDDGEWSAETLQEFAQRRATAELDVAPAMIQQLDAAGTGVKNAGALWPQLLLFPGLASLHVRVAELSIAQWSELPRAFAHLRRLSIVGREKERALWSKQQKDDPTLSTLWPAAVAQCAQLTDLRLAGLRLSSAQLQQVSIVVSHQLRSLAFERCELPSGGSLTSLLSPAPSSLTSLSILSCGVPQEGLDFDFFAGYFENLSIDWRLCLREASLPQLRRLHNPRSGAVMTGEEHLQRRKELIARMPMLADVNFKQ
jgi:hypothetical protein